MTGPAPFAMAGNVPTVVDIIIAGGGASGCVVAARLAAAHPSLSILLVEGGISNKDHPQVVNPALFPTNLMPGSTTARFYKSLSAKEVDGREFDVATGGCLGGGSSVNFMAYVRGSRSDYDDFETDGWRSEDLIPLMRKTETFHIPDDNVDTSVHGFQGEFHVSQGGKYHQKELVGEFLDAASAAGWEKTNDPQDLDTGNAFGPLASWIHPKTGRRQDAAHTLIHPLLALQSTKLQVLTEHDVIRVLFNIDNRATGIEILARNCEQAIPLIISARKLVVLSAGAFGSSLILERSGVGHQDILDKIQVPKVYANPGIGDNYQDHPVILWPYSSSGGPETTLDCILSGRLSVEVAFAEDTGILTSNHIEGIGKIRPSGSDIASLSPELQQLWNCDFKNRPDKPLSLVLMASGYIGDHSIVPVGQYISLSTTVAYPYSRGSVHATGPKVTDAPVFDAAFIREDADLEVLVWAYKKQREIARRMDRYQGPLLSGHPVFKEGAKASFEVADRDIGKIPKEEIVNVEYTKEDDEAIAKFLRGAVGSMWHSLGTCAMKSLENGGVVDGKLNVYGVQGLKVADLSIVPKMVGANTYSTALMVGEKAAEIILKELEV